MSLYDLVNSNYEFEKSEVRVGNVFDSGKAFFVVLEIKESNGFTRVTGDIINDSRCIQEITMGRSLMMSIYDHKLMDSVFESFIWGSFYKKRMPRIPEEI